MRRKLLQLLGVLIVVASGAATITGCGGPSRSVAAYCSYFYGEGEQLRNRWLRADQADSKDPVAELGSVFADLPEAANFFHQLSLRAPEEIAPDVQALAEALSKATDQVSAAASDPLGALAGDLVDGIAVSGAEQRVSQYTERHCGPPPTGGGASGGS